MAKPLVFISYKHQAPWSDHAKLLDLKLRNVAPAFGYDVFLDKRMEAGVLWSEEIDVALDATTHFIAMLCDPYWASEQCMREFHGAIRRYEAEKSDGAPRPRLLFVRAGAIDARHFTFNEARKAGALSCHDPQINSLADINFLGPFDLENVGHLEILDWANSLRLDEQLGQLRDRFIETMAK
jgi:hypothetical protein